MRLSAIGGSPFDEKKRQEQRHSQKDSGNDRSSCIYGFPENAAWWPTVRITK